MIGRRVFAVAGLVAILLGLAAGPASAHPLGNFTINVYAGLTAASDVLEIDYVVDMAEIPAFQAARVIDADGDGTTSDAESAGYAAAECGRLSGRIRTSVDGVLVTSVVASNEIAFPDGAGGLQTLRLECRLFAPAMLSTGSLLSFGDDNFAGRLGWHEVTATGRDLTLDADVPAIGMSERLTTFPADALRSALDIRKASIRITAVAPGAGHDAETHSPSSADRSSGLDGLSRSFVSLVSRQRVTAGFAMLAVLGAIALGALHAAAPGHGKALIGAAVIGTRGTRRQAFILGATVAAAHTVGVVGIGLAIAASDVAAPERAYPWLTFAGGVLATAVGIGLVRGWVRSRTPRHDHDEDHAHPHRYTPPRQKLMWLGLTGGLAPSPSALLVLLASITLGRVWLGVVLVVSYGVGMALTLSGLALLMTRAGKALDERASRTGVVARLAAASRPVGALGVLGAGLLLVARGAVAI